MQPTFRSQSFIGGEYVPAASGKTFPVLNPTRKRGHPLEGSCQQVAPLREHFFHAPLVAFPSATE